MLDNVQQAMIALAESTRETSKELIANATVSQQNFLTTFATSVDRAIDLHCTPMAQLCPVLQQCVSNLAATRDVVSSLTRPLLLQQAFLLRIENRVPNRETQARRTEFRL
jgi:hypothetical protein